MPGARDSGQGWKGFLHAVARGSKRGGSRRSKASLEWKRGAIRKFLQKSFAIEVQNSQSTFHPE